MATIPIVPGTARAPRPWDESSAPRKFRSQLGVTGARLNGAEGLILLNFSIPERRALSSVCECQGLANQLQGLVLIVESSGKDPALALIEAGVDAAHQLSIDAGRAPHLAGVFGTEAKGLPSIGVGVDQGGIGEGELSTHESSAVRGVA